MGLRSSTTHDTAPFDRQAAEARVQALESTLPAGTRIRLIEPGKGLELTYLVRTVGDRSSSSALLAAIVDVVRAGDEHWAVDLSVHATDADTSPCTTFVLPDDALPALELLLDAHDELHAALPTQTIGLDATDGTFTISGVPRDAALATARLAARWWETLLQRAEGRWRDSSLSVAVGGDGGTDGVPAEISYDATIAREPDPMGYHRSDNGSRKVSDAVWTARVVAAWTENLPALEAMLRLPVPPDHEVDLSFDEDSLRPQLAVCHHETYEDDDVTAEALVAIIRSEVPESRLTVG